MQTVERRRRLARAALQENAAGLVCDTQTGLGQGICAIPGTCYRLASHRATISFVARGRSAVGSASPCQGEGRGFESRRPLEGSHINPAVEWPSGEATACKAVHTGSIPVSTSIFDPPARLAQRESASLTRKRSLVQSQYRAPEFVQVKGSFRSHETAP